MYVLANAAIVVIDIMNLKLMSISSQEPGDMNDVDPSYVEVRRG